MANYEAVIKLIVNGEAALTAVKKEVDELYKTISKIEKAGILNSKATEATLVATKQHANELERAAQATLRQIKQNEQRIIQQSKLNAAVDLYERRLTQATNSGAAGLKKFEGQIGQIEKAFSFFKDRKNVTAVQALATELGRMVEYSNTVSRNERARAASLSQLRGFAKQLAEYELQGLNTAAAREKFDKLAVVAGSNQLNGIKKYTEALVRQLQLLKEKAAIQAQVAKETAALQGGLANLEQEQRQLENSKLDQKATQIQVALDRQAKAATETATQTAKLSQSQLEFTERTDAAARAASRQTAEYLRMQRAAREVAKINQLAGPAQLLLPQAAAGSPLMSGGARPLITGPVERAGGARTAEDAALALRYAQALKEQVRPLSQIQALYGGIYREASKLQQVKALPDTGMLNAAVRGIKQLETAEDQLNRERQESVQRLQQIDRLEESRARRAQKLQNIASYLSEQVPPGTAPPLPPKVKGMSDIGGKTGQKTQTQQGSRPGSLDFNPNPSAENLALGAGFPLLFGGGPAQVAGGLLGSMFGTGFGGQILGSAIAQQLSDVLVRVKDIGSAAKTLNMDALRDSVVYVNAELETSVRRLVEVGKAEEARAALTKAAADSLGLTTDAMQDINNATKAVQGEWDQFVGAITGTLAIIGAPFAAALAGILKVVTLLVKGFNAIQTFIFGGLKGATDWLLRVTGLKSVVDKIGTAFGFVSEEQQKLAAALQADIDRTKVQLGLQQGILDLEKQRTLGYSQMDRLKNIDIDNTQELMKIEAAADEKKLALREQYKGLNDKDLAVKLQQVDAEKAMNIETLNLNTKKQITLELSKKTYEAEERQLEALRAQQTAVQAQSETYGRIGSIVSARITSEQTLAALQGTELERRYEAATTEQKRLDIAKAIFNNSVLQAQLEYQQGLATLAIQEEQNKLAVSTAVLKRSEIIAEGQLAILRATTLEDETRKRGQLEAAVAAQNGVIRGVVEQGVAQQIINKYAAQNLGYAYRSQVVAAGYALQQKLISDRIGMSTINANSLTQGMVNAALSTETMTNTTANLTTKMGEAATELKTGTDAALQNVQVFGTAAVQSAQSQDAWRESVLRGVGAQQQVSTAVQQTTGKVVAANNIRATSAIKADAEVVKSNAAANKKITEASGFSVKRLQDNWKSFTTYFSTNVTAPITKLWDAMIKALPNAMQSAANLIQGIWSTVLGQIRGFFSSFIIGMLNNVNSAIRAINSVIAEFNKLPTPPFPDIGYLDYIQVPGFAEGGIVDKPTLAMVGEGGEREFIIPESKMAAASANYLTSGSGGNNNFGGGTAQISITTGPVIQMDGEQYVTLYDLEQAMQMTADGVYKSLRTSSGRYATGVR